jgi:hypothetical protein
VIKKYPQPLYDVEDKMQITIYRVSKEKLNKFKRLDMSSPKISNLKMIA